MDTIKFLEERKRMCESFGDECKGCPANSCIYKCKLDVNTSTEAAQQIKLVEEWSAAHPRKTRQSVFLEQYPNARIDRQAVIYVCPADAYGDKVCPKNEENFHMLCPNCRSEFWMQEVE